MEYRDHRMFQVLVPLEQTRPMSPSTNYFSSFWTTLLQVQRWPSWGRLQKKRSYSLASSCSGFSPYSHWSLNQVGHILCQTKPFNGTTKVLTQSSLAVPISLWSTHNHTMASQIACTSCGPQLAFQVLIWNNAILSSQHRPPKVSELWLSCLRNKEVASLAFPQTMLKWMTCVGRWTTG